MLAISGCSNSDGKEMAVKAEITHDESKAAYDLYPTTNLWNFIKLNTRNGKMWLVQYTIDDDKNRMTAPLSEEPRVPVKDETNGRFKLVPTQNIHNFILLDQIDGRTWQVQWGLEPDQCMVIPIE